MNKNNIFFFTIFGILLIFGLFTVYPQSGQISLEDKGIDVEGTYSVNSSWDSEGNLIGNIESDGDKIYVQGNSQGSWVSDLQQGDNFDFINISGVANPSDGNITYQLRVWQTEKTSKPDETFNGSITQPQFNDKITGLDPYDIWEIQINLSETSGSNNEKPNVQSLNIKYVENLNRSDLGLNKESVQYIILFVFLGSTMLALFTVFEEKEN